MNNDVPREAADKTCPEVFLSYSRRDKERVRELVTQLRDAGFDIWIDETGIELSTRWSEEIVEGITGAKVFLLIATRDSLASPNVAREISLASEEKKPLFPVFLEECEIPASVRYELAGVQHLQLFGEGQDGAFERLVAALHEAVGKEGSQVAPSNPPSKSSKNKGMPKAALAVVAIAVVTTVSVATGLFDRESEASHSVPLYVEPEAEHKVYDGLRLRVWELNAADEKTQEEPREFVLGKDHTAFYFGGSKEALPEEASDDRVDYHDALPYPRGTKILIELGKGTEILESGQFPLTPRSGAPCVVASLKITGP